jgi:signal transduction histidine kinase
MDNDLGRVVGLDPQRVPRLFEPFFTTRSGGTFAFSIPSGQAPGAGRTSAAADADQLVSAS